MFYSTGIPPHALYNMNGPANRGYLSYIMRNIRRAPQAEIRASGGSAQFVPGKDMMGLSLSDATVEITQALREQECYNNIGKLIQHV